VIKVHRGDPAASPDEDLVDHPRWLDAREAEIEALRTERQPSVVDAEAVQHRGMQVVGRRGPLHHVVGKLIRPPERDAGLDPAAGQRLLLGDRFPLPDSPGYHAFRHWYGWEPVPVERRLGIPAWKVADLHEGRSDPCEEMV
jgi:hypothetical protein